MQIVVAGEKFKKRNANEERNRSEGKKKKRQKKYPGLGFSVALLKFGGVDGIGDQLIQNGYSLLSPLVGCLFYIDYQKSYTV